MEMNAHLIEDAMVWVTEFGYIELRIGIKEPRIIGPLLEELPLVEWVQIMWPEGWDAHS